MAKTIEVTEDLHQYLVEHSIPSDRLVEELVEVTSPLEQGDMQIAPLQGPLLHLLVKLIGARRILEIGTFTGMSSLWMSRALPPDGKILCCDVSEQWTSTAQEFWERAGVRDKIELRIGPAAETLASLPAETVFDMAFLDANKPGYPDYLDPVVSRLRPGGLFVADNVLWKGRVVDRDDHSEATEAIRTFNRMVAEHPSLEAVVLPVADGMTLARKAG